MCARLGARERLLEDSVCVRFGVRSASALATSSDVAAVGAYCAGIAAVFRNAPACAGVIAAPLLALLFLSDDDPAGGSPRTPSRSALDDADASWKSVSHTSQRDFVTQKKIFEEKKTLE